MSAGKNNENAFGNALPEAFFFGLVSRAISAFQAGFNFKPNHFFTRAAQLDILTPLQTLAARCERRLRNTLVSGSERNRMASLQPSSSFSESR